jgi:hypothetical protein
MTKQQMIENILDDIGVHLFEQSVKPNVSDKILDESVDYLLTLENDQLEYIQNEGIFVSDFIDNICRVNNV